MKLYSLCVFILLSAGIFSCFVASTPPSYAGEYVCGTPQGPGSAFYDFDRIVIYYSYFTYRDAQKVPNYPSALKYDNFSDLLLKHVEKSFGPCLSRSSGFKKPILITKIFIPEISDPKTLSIIIAVSLNISTPSAPREIEYGMLRYNLYRPGLTPETDLMLFRNSSRAKAVFPKMNNVRLDDQIEDFLKSITPINYLWELPEAKQERQPGVVVPVKREEK